MGTFIAFFLGLIAVGFALLLLLILATVALDVVTDGVSTDWVKRKFQEGIANDNSK